MKILLREFNFLQTIYGMQVIDKYLKGSFPFVIWSNGKINVKVGFDFTDNVPVHIFVYEVNDVAMFEAKEFAEELNNNAIKNNEIDMIIKYAAEKFFEILQHDERLIS